MADVAANPDHIAAIGESETSSEVESGASQVFSQVGTAAGLAFQLPPFYSVGLRSYCEGTPDGKAYARCSKPSNLFSFDVLSILKNQSHDIKKLVPKRIRKALAGYGGASRFAIRAYFISTITSALGVAFSIELAIVESGRQGSIIDKRKWSGFANLAIATVSSRIPVLPHLC